MRRQPEAENIIIARLLSIRGKHCFFHEDVIYLLFLFFQPYPGMRSLRVTSLTLGRSMFGFDAACMSTAVADGLSLTAAAREGSGFCRSQKRLVVGREVTSLVFGRLESLPVVGRCLPRRAAPCAEQMNTRCARSDTHYCMYEVEISSSFSWYNFHNILCLP